MSVTPADQSPSVKTGAAQPVGFWQRLAQALDAYVVKRSKRAVPAITLRRSRHELARCRRLVHRPGTTGLGNSPVAGTRS